MNKSFIDFLTFFSLSIIFGVTLIYSLSSTVSLSMVGIIKAVGVQVYTNSTKTSELTAIDWGILAPGDSEIYSCYIVSTGNVPSILTMNTSNWFPVNASDFITLDWNYSGQILNENEGIPINFILTISSMIEGITIFSFNIFIIIQEA